jgi:hypothetical protein
MSQSEMSQSKVRSVCGARWRATRRASAAWCVGVRERGIRLRSIASILVAVTLATGLASGFGPASAVASSTVGEPAGPSSLVASTRQFAALHGTSSSLVRQRLVEQAVAGSATTSNTPKVTTGTVTGVVHGVHGDAVSGTCVTATSATKTVMALTGSTGRYILNGLLPGRYVLSYRDCARPGRYFEQWSGGAAWPSLAKPVTVSPGQVRTMPAIVLRTTDPIAMLSSRARPVHSEASQPDRHGTASISGVVTGNGKPVRGICVEDAQLHNGFSVGTDVTTSRSGRYTFRGLTSGRYQITFAPIFDCADPGNWLQQFYKGFTNVFPPDNQTTIRLRAGEHLRHIDASLKRGSQISGTVTSASGRGLGRICVEITAFVKDGIVIAGFVTGRKGRYAWPGVFPGRYLVNFTSGCGNKGNYAPQWWPHSATQSHARPVRVTGSKPHNHIDAAMRPGAAITGKVTARSTGAGVGQVCVDASNADGTIDVEATTQADGRYRIQGLGTGQYLVQFDPTCGNLNLLGTQRFVTVKDGKTVTGFDAALQPGAGVSGTVKDAHGHPLDGICVTVNDPFETFGTETGNGSYSVVGLTPGQVATVEFTGGCDNNGNFAPQFYDDQGNPTVADPVSLKAGVVTPGIDATMQPGSTISGIVTDAAGRRLSNICVAILPGSQSVLSETFEDEVNTSNGRYSDRDLAPGPYLVDFGCGGGPFVDQWFRAQPVGQADVVSVRPGAVTSGIDAVLRPAGAISGVVTNSSGRKLSNLCVLAVNRRTGAQPPTLAVTQNGRYVLFGIAPGRYEVQFSECIQVGKYGSQWYSDKRTLASATPVRVTAGHTTAGVDATMATGGSISGRVVSRLGKPLSNVCVLAIDDATSSVGFGVTNKTGSYTMLGLSTGSYAVSFSPCNGQNLVTVFRPGTVRVTAPHGVRGINARPSTGGLISGTVTFGTAPEKPLAGVCVEVISPPDAVEAFGFTGPHGGYSADGLATGSYRVLFGSPDCVGYIGFAPQWFRDEPAESGADPVSVTAGSTTSHISATLQPGGLGAISGHLTRSGGQAVSGECVTAFPLSPSNPTFGSVQPEIAVSSGSGGYSLVDLVPGRYKVRFDVGCGATGLTTQWWRAAKSAAAATVITVAANATVTGIDAALGH